MGYISQLERMQQIAAEKQKETATKSASKGYVAGLERMQQLAKSDNSRSDNTTTESAGAVTLPRREAAIERASGAFDVPQTSGVIKQGKFDALAPMRGTMEAAKPVIEAQKELAAEKASSGYVSGGTDASGRRKVEYKTPNYGKLSQLEQKADTAQKTFQRGILEKATEGKTAEADHMRQLLQRQRKNLFNIDPAYLSAAERAKYNVLYERDPGLADTYLDTIAAEVNARGAREESEKLKGFAKEHPVLGTVANVAGSFVAPLSAAEMAISKLKGKESDPNSIWHIGSRLTEATQEGLTGDIKNPFGKFLADTGLSMAQYLSKLPLGGAAALAVMASGAAGQTAYSARQSGADTDEALLLGTIAGVSEAVLEKLPLDNILASFKGGDRAGVVARLTGMIKQPIRDMLGSAVEEGGEEILTEYINTLADAVIRGEQSDMMRYRDELIASGMSKQEADRKAKTMYLVTNPLLSFAGGALSGGVMAGIGTGSNWAQGKIGTAVQNRIERQNAKKQASEAAQGDATVQNDSTVQETQEADTEGESLADAFEGATAPGTSQAEPESNFASFLDDEEMNMLPDWAVEEERAARAAADAAAREAESNEMISEVTNPLLNGENPLFTAAEETRRKRAETAKNDTQRTGYLAGATDEDIALAETVSRLYGRRVVFESNNYRINGRYEDGTIYLNPNSNNVLASTLAHELTHTAEGYKHYNDLMSVVREMYTAEGKNWNELREEVFGRGYAELYKKQGRTFTETDADREIVADAVAQILGSQEKLDSFVKSHHSIAARWWYKVKSLIGRITGKQPRAQMTDAERMVVSYHKQIEAMLGEALRKTKRQSAAASGVQYSIRYDTNNTPYVTIEKDVLSGVPRDRWITEIKKYIPTVSSVVLGNSNIYINRRSKNELLKSEYSKTLDRRNPDLFKDKLNTLQNIDEVIRATRDYVNEAIKHDRKDNIIQFARGNVQLDILGREYKADVDYGYTSGGNILLYDIVNITPTVIQKKSDMDLQNNGKNRRLQTSISDTNSIPQNGGNVNPYGEKYSLSAEGENQRQTAIRMLQDGADPEQVYEDTGYFVDDTGTVRTEAESPKKKNLSASKAMKSIKAVVADMVDVMTGENHTNAFKRDVLNRIIDQYDAMSDVGSDAEYRQQSETFRKFADELAQEIVDNNRIRNADNERIANDIKAQLRTQIKVSENAKRDFYGEKGWNAWRKSQMGKLNLTNDKGIGIDTLYMQLSSQYPKYFPESIENEGDMLRRMAEVREIVDGEDFIHDSYYGFSGGDTAARADAERISEMIRRGWEIVKDMPSYDTSRIARSEISRVREGYEKRIEKREQEFGAAIREADERLDRANTRLKEEKENQRRITKERLDRETERKQYNAYRKRMRGGSVSIDAIAKSISDNTFVQQMNKLYAKSKENQEEAAKYAKVDLKEVDMETRRYIQKIRDRAEDIKVYIRRVGQARRKVLRQQALEILRSGDIEKWKDKRAGVFHSVGTMIRNITDISDGDELGKKILSKYFDPIAKHVAEATRLKNTMRQRVRELNLSTVPSGNNELSESAFVQLYGEAKDNIYMLENKLGYKNVFNGEARRGGRTLQEWRDVLNQLATDNPDIVNNTETMKKIDNAVEVFKKLYDELMPLINDVRIYNGYEPIAYRHGYFPHFSSQVKADGVFSSLLDGLGISPDLDGLPTTINGLTSRFRPGMQYQAFDKQRTDNTGKEYDGVHLVGMGAVEGFDRYIEVAANVIYLTGDVQKLRALSDSIRYNASDEGIKEQVDSIRNNGELDESERETVIENLLKGSKTRLNNFVVELEEYTNLLAGKKSLRDREAEQFLGRQFYRLTKNIESRIAANMVAINPGSWLTNFVPLTQAGAVLKTGSMLGAMGETIKAVKEDDGFVARSSFLTNRLGSERLVKRTSQEIGDVLAQPMQWIDNFTASTIVRARYSENINKGMSADEAMQEADKFAAAIMGDRSQGAMPTIFAQQNPITKLFTQYQLEVANQLAWMTKDLPRMYKDDKKKLAAALLKLALYGWLYNLIYHAFTGRDAAFDPIGVLNDTVGDFTGYSLPDIGEAASAIFSDKVTWKDIMKTARKKPGEALGNLGTAALEQLPFTAGLGALIPDFDAGRIPISSAMPDLTQLGNIFDPETAWQKKLQSAYKLASPVATYLAPPFGGGQIKKTAESIAAIAQGGSYTYNKEGERQLQYPIYTDNALDVIGKVPMAVFGKSSSSAGRDWIESGFKTQSVKNTQAYENLVKSGVSQREAWAAVNGISGTTIAEKAASLDKMQLDGKAKAQLYYDRVLSENSKARGVMDKIGKTAEAYELLSAFAQFDTTSEKAAALQFSKLGDKEREIVFNELVTGSYADVTGGLAADGISFGDFLKVYQAGLDYEQHGMVKKEAILTAIDSLNLSKAQKDKLYLCFFNESLLKNAPWNTLFRMPELPALEIPDIRIPKLNLPF